MVSYLISDAVCYHWWLPRAHSCRCVCFPVTFLNISFITAPLLWVVFICQPAQSLLPPPLPPPLHRYFIKHDSSNLWIDAVWFVQTNWCLMLFCFPCFFVDFLQHWNEHQGLDLCVKNCFLRQTFSFCKYVLCDFFQVFRKYFCRFCPQMFSAKLSFSWQRAMVEEYIHAIYSN